MLQSSSHVRLLSPVSSPQGLAPATFLICNLLLAVLTIKPPAHSAGYRAIPLLPPNGSGKPGFTLLPAHQLGIDFTNHLSDSRVRKFQNSMNGCGVAAGDFNGDGWCDLFFCNKDGPSALFRATGAGSFANVTALTGTAVTNQISAGAAFADLNGDGRLDLFVSSFGGPNALLLQEADGQFTDTTAPSGLVGRTGSTSMAMGDLDGDGDLDLYLCNFGTLSVLRDGGQVSTRMVNGKPVVTGRYAAKIKIIDGLMVEFGEPDAVYWNDGSGRFTAANWGESFLDEDGKPYLVQPDFGLAVQIRDTNGDGLPDIYV
ncbi:MAG: VCBS repeat-containing protein [Verrucomicrobia bacterium]|nr:VCBS repeat-containing protein [Verrucomicrobiota bacterium]